MHETLAAKGLSMLLSLALSFTGADGTLFHEGSPNDEGEESTDAKIAVRSAGTAAAEAPETPETPATPGASDPSETPSAPGASLVPDESDPLEDYYDDIEDPEISQVVNTAEGIVATWEPVENAGEYYLFRKCKGAGDGWVQIATLDVSTLTYTDTQVEPGNIYFYRLKALNVKDGELSDYGDYQTCKRLLPPTGLKAASASRGIALTWDLSLGAGGYRVYRQLEGEADWTHVADVTSGNARYWLDTSVTDGVRYRYQLAAYSGESESLQSSAKVSCYVAAPAVKSLKRKNSTSYVVKWSKNATAAGYQLQYSKSSMFTSKKTVKVTSPSTVKYVLKGLKKKTTYYVRVRAYAKVNGKTYYSAWSHSANVASSRSLSPTQLKRTAKKVVELRAQAKQSMFGYDTVQGSCTDGTYAYFCLYNRSVEKCKIAKVKLSTNKVVKVSDVLEIAHGNDMTYDSERKCLVVAHCTGNGKRLSLINRSKLAVMSTVDVVIPKGLSGATDAQRKAATSFSGIAYNAKRNQFAVLLAGSHNFLILDADFQPLRYVEANVKSSAMYQGIDATDDYILVTVSPRSSAQSNAVLAYSWDGVYLARANLKGLDEAESVFHVGSKYYVSVYRSYMKTVTVKEKKKVKVNGKWKTKTVKVKKRQLARDNYLYRIKGF